MGQHLTKRLRINENGKYFQKLTGPKERRCIAEKSLEDGASENHFLGEEALDSLGAGSN